MLPGGRPIRFLSIFLPLSLAAIVVGYFLFWDTHTPQSGSVGADVQAAWKKVVRQPDDPQSWARLGEVQEDANYLAAAEHSYRMAIRLGDDSGIAYARLGFLVYAQGKDAHALSLLAEAKNRNARLPMLDTIVTTLEQSLPSITDHGFQSGKQSLPTRGLGPGDNPSSKHDIHPSDTPDPASAPQAQTSPENPPPRPTDPTAAKPAIDPIGSGITPATGRELETRCQEPMLKLPGGGTYAAKIEFGDVITELIIDTGASITVITEEVADELALDTTNEPAIQVITANGRTTFPTAIVSEVWVGDRVVRDIRVAICDNCVQDIADGLLGLDLQGALGMILDLGNQQITFRDCEEN